MFKSVALTRVLIVFCLLFYGLTVCAQQFGGNPPSLKWNQVNTPAALIIYPRGLDSIALRVASIIQQMNPVIRPTIGTKQKQVNIVLQNQTIISNGFVMLAPFHSEFYLTPDQNSFELGTLPWDEQLAIHEFRHVQQYNNFNVGLSKTLHILFGESGQLLGNSVAIPNWFYEGDAVFNETHVSDQGRGRLPYFFNGFRGIWEAGKDYSWMKIRNGSFVDYTPDWYPLGYMMVAYGREKYGPLFWRDVTHDAAAFKSLFYPLQSAIKQYSGVGFEQFRNNALDYFKQQIALPPSQAVGPKFKKNQHFIADIEYPAQVDDNAVIYVKSSYKDIPKFIIRKNGHERVIRVKGLSLDRYFNYHDGKIVYVSYRPDLRWGYRDYNEICIIDAATGKETRITHSSKYFSPAFSNDGKAIVAVDVEPSGKNNLHILDAANGTIIRKVPNPEGLFFTYPRFYDAGHVVAGVRNKTGNITLALINITDGKAEPLINYSKAPLAFLTVQRDTVYFTANTGLNDRLYALSVKNKQLYLLQNDSLEKAIGNYEVSVAGNKLAWVSFTAYGYQLHQTDKSAIRFEPVDNGSAGYLTDYKINALKKDSAADLLAKVETKSLKTQKYSKLHNLFNFHSVVPNFDDPNYTIGIEGQNVINTFQSEIFGTYNRDEGYKRFGYNAIYGALFPYIDAGANYTVDRKGYYRGQNIYWNETQVHAGLEIPLNFSGGRHSTYLSFGSDAYYDDTHFQQPFRSMFSDGSFTYLYNYLNFSNSMQQATQNIYPHLAQSISLVYEKGVISQYNYQFLATGNFYFPGFSVNHNFVINLAHQQRSADAVIDFSNDFPFSRGYTAYNLYQMDKVGINYHFPIAYPDAGVANLVFLQRLRGNLFFDYSHAKDFYSDGTPFSGNFRSAGAELYFDTSWFNELPVSFGIRYSRLMDDDLGGRGRNQIEFVVPLTLF